MQAWFGGLKIFSSHSWAHGEDRIRLHEHLEDAWVKWVDFVDLSAPADHPIHHLDSQRQLAIALGERLRACDVFLIFTGMYADSFWINFEVNAALLFGKPIIPIAPWGQQRHSTVATRFASCDIVRWNGASIRQAILDHVDPAKRAAFERQVFERKLARLIAMEHDRRNPPPRLGPPTTAPKASPVGAPAIMTRLARGPHDKW